MNNRTQYRGSAKRIALTVAALTLLLFLLAAVCLFVGSSNMTPKETLAALFGRGTPAQVRIVQNVRLPRVIAATVAGAGLALAGLLMQTALNNPMASPSTLGVSNAAIFGANLSIIVFAGGFLSGGDPGFAASAANPFATSAAAFLFAILSTVLVLALCRLKSFRPDVVVLAGIAVGSVWTAATTILQFYATDAGLSAAVVWSFGDLGRATYKTDLIMAAVVLGGVLFALLVCRRLNALLGGDAAAKSAGINTGLLRFAALAVASLITATCVSFLGVIGFVGIICPHIVKKLLGEDHRLTVPCSLLAGSILLLFADTLSRTVGKGTAVPAGAVTALLGAPFFLAIIFTSRRRTGDV